MSDDRIHQREDGTRYVRSDEFAASEAGRELLRRVNVTTSPASGEAESYPALKRQKEPPSKAGWYWCKLSYNDRPLPFHCTYYKDRFVAVRHIKSVDETDPPTVKEMHECRVEWWAGPIRRPEAESAG